jgi:hypothetical protein
MIYWSILQFKKLCHLQVSDCEYMQELFRCCWNTVSWVWFGVWFHRAWMNTDHIAHCRLQHNRPPEAVWVTCIPCYDTIRTRQLKWSHIWRHIKMEPPSGSSQPKTWNVLVSFGFHGNPNSAWGHGSAVQSIPRLGNLALLLVLICSFEEKYLTLFFLACWADLSGEDLGRTDSSRQDRGLNINDAVFAHQWTRNWGAHCWFHSEPEEYCDYKKPNCSKTHSTVGLATAAAIITNSPGISLIVVVPPTPTCSVTNGDNLRWQVYSVLYDLHIRIVQRTSPCIKQILSSHQWNHELQYTRQQIREITANIG